MGPSHVFYPFFRRSGSSRYGKPVSIGVREPEPQKMQGQVKGGGNGSHRLCGWMRPKNTGSAPDACNMVSLPVVAGGFGVLV